MLDKDPAKRLTVRNSCPYLAHTMQIPEVLNHSALQYPGHRTSLWVPPPTPRPRYTEASSPILRDLAFLAYLNNDFYLCETYERFEQSLEGSDSCWEKRWADFLSKWEKGFEMEWEDKVRPRKVVPNRTGWLPSSICANSLFDISQRMPPRQKLQVDLFGRSRSRLM